MCIPRGQIGRPADLAPPYRSIVYDVVALQDRAGRRGAPLPPATKEGGELLGQARALLDDDATSEIAFHRWLCHLRDHVRGRLDRGELELCEGGQASDLWASVQRLADAPAPLPPADPRDYRRRPGAASRIATAAARGH